MLSSLLFGYLGIAALLTAIISTLAIVAASLGDHSVSPWLAPVAVLSAGAAVPLLRLGARSQRRAFVAASNHRGAERRGRHALGLNRRHWPNAGYLLAYSMLVLLGALNLDRYLTTDAYFGGRAVRDPVVLTGPDALVAALAPLVAGMLGFCALAYSYVRAHRDRRAAQQGNGAGVP